MLRPIDIQNKEFEKKLKGYNCDEVDDFLDVVIQDYELLCKENQTLKDKIGLLTETVERYKQMENTMRSRLTLPSKLPRTQREMPKQRRMQLSVKQSLTRLILHVRLMMNI